MTSSARRRLRHFADDFQRNVGVAGVVYLLANDGLRAGWLKIGCSRRSGSARAADLNADANTGTPGAFRCIFEQRTVDCGRAEKIVFARLAAHRRGKRGQEFFEVDLVHAREVIAAVCRQVNQGAPMLRAAMPALPPGLQPKEVMRLPPWQAPPPAPLRRDGVQPEWWRRPAGWVGAVVFIIWFSYQVIAHR